MQRNTISMGFKEVLDRYGGAIEEEVPFTS